MNKRLLAVIVACVLIITAFAGCNTTKPADNEPTKEPAKVTDAPKATDVPVVTESPAPTEVPTKVEVGSYIRFGAYEQDNDESNGKESIEWIVLDKEDDKALVISKYALDFQQYITSDTTQTWETCLLREWLNGTFLNAAFSSEEQKSIISSTVKVDAYDSYTTTDKVFILSDHELYEYYSSESALESILECQVTAYCYALGAFKDSNGNCGWWTRIPDYAPDSVYIARGDGSFFAFEGLSGMAYAVRPALWIKLDS